MSDAIFNSAYFWQMATDERGVIQIFNVGAEAMLGYDAVDVVDRITPADISDPQELIKRAAELSVELDTPIAPGFEALVFKAKRGIEDIYELMRCRSGASAPRGLPAGCWECSRLTLKEAPNGRVCRETVRRNRSASSPDGDRADHRGW